MKTVIREFIASSSTGRVEDGLHVTVRRSLASPDFLYRSLQTGRPDDFDLASRLSYFLTSAPPDDQLIELANLGEQSNPDVLQRDAAVIE